MRRRWVAIAATVAIGCGGHDEPSWGTPDYVTAGVPSPDHRWSNAEHAAAVDTIARASVGHAARLPRFADPRSGAVFARLAEESPADDPAATVATRFGARAERGESLRRAFSLYDPGLGTPTREFIELSGALLREYVALERLTVPFLATFAPDDPKLPARRAGLAKFHEGAGMMMVGALMVADQRRVADADRLALLAHLAAAIPTLFPVLPPRYRDDARDRAIKLAEGTTGAIHDAAVAVQRAMPRP